MVRLTCRKTAAASLVPIPGRGELNRRPHVSGRMRLSDPERRSTLAEISNCLGRIPLEEVASAAKPGTIFSLTSVDRRQILHRSRMLIRERSPYFAKGLSDKEIWLYDYATPPRDDFIPPYNGFHNSGRTLAPSLGKIPGATPPSHQQRAGKFAVSTCGWALPVRIAPTAH